MNGTPRSVRLSLLLACLGSGGAVAADAIYERAPIHYHETEPDTRLTRYFAEQRDNPVLRHGTHREILDELLRGLEIPAESQVLVYSKTSAQNSRIAPETPRAIYFSDDLYLGWVQGGEIETASFDARLGMVFHLVKLSEREPGALPPLARERSCLNCHAGSSNREMPGLMVRSVYPTATGLPLFEAGTFHTRQDSPIEQRWGGWYVTGAVEGREHLGNALAKAAPGGPGVELERLAEGRLSSLDGLFVSEPYPGGGQSDVVALMVLEHQVGVHNLLVEANLSTRATLHRHAEMQKAFGEPVEAPLSETNERILQRLATRVLREMLYVEEVEVPAGIEGTGAFQAAFEEGRRKSAEGRSLRDLRLYGRLMKYRCSHLIHSEAFATLPPAIRDRILVQLHGILTRPAEWPEFAHLGESERAHILAIVGETVTGLPDCWR
jgi:hypothetical protein